MRAPGKAWPGVTPTPTRSELVYRDELRIALCPDQAALLRVGPGWPGRMREARVADCVANRVAGAQEPWRAPLAALASLLAQRPSRGGGARVVLSNHFLRYALVPLPPGLPDDPARDAYQRHHLRQLHGDAALGWALRWHEVGAPGNRSGSRLVCGLDPALTAALEQTCRATGWRLRGLRPWLMAGFNPWHRRLGRGRHWFALAEAQRLLLARIVDGQWLTLRSQRLGANWRAELAGMLERERFLAADPAPEDGLWLVAPGLDLAPPMESPLRSLALPPLPGFPADAEGALAMARYA